MGLPCCSYRDGVLRQGSGNGSEFQVQGYKTQGVWCETLDLQTLSPEPKP